MPIEIYIVVLATCGSIVILMVLLAAAVVYLALKLTWAEAAITTLHSDVTALINESRAGIVDFRQATARTSQTTDDIAHITHTARGWTDRANHLVNAVEAIAKPPILFHSKNIPTAGKIAILLVQAFLNPKP